MYLIQIYEEPSYPRGKNKAGGTMPGTAVTRWSRIAYFNLVVE